MQIGAFAKICGTKISVLRHYDKEGLLQPDYVDRFTSYRYYSAEQIPIFLRITALKKAGFSLPEIRQMLSHLQSDSEMQSLFKKKKTELHAMLAELEKARKMMRGGYSSMMELKFTEKHGMLQAASEPFDANLQNEMREDMEKALLADRYQRISGYRVHGEPGTNEVYLTCDAVKLDDTPRSVQENIDLPFADDASIVGKWEIIGEFAVKEDFYGAVCKDASVYGEQIKEIYFLPRGERYWCFGWTRGKLLHRSGDSSTVNEYTTEMYDGSRYMFVALKSYEYRYGGYPTTLVLRQIDNVAYTKKEIARRDNVELPFADDRRVVGKWRAVDFIRAVESFDPACPSGQGLFFAAVEFLPDGDIACAFDYGKRSLHDRARLCWTKGVFLNKADRTAGAYTIREVGGVEYLFIEWKSGDYIYGGMDPQFYVFAREE